MTLGVGTRLGEKAGISPVELEGREELRWEGPRLGQRPYMFDAPELMQLEPFQLAAAGGAAAYIIHMEKGGQRHHACNDAFARMVGGIGWPGRQMQTCKVMSSILGGACCAPADRPVFFEVRQSVSLSLPPSLAVSLALPLPVSVDGRASEPAQHMTSSHTRTHARMHSPIPRHPPLPCFAATARRRPWRTTRSTTRPGPTTGMWPS